MLQLKLLNIILLFFTMTDTDMTSGSATTRATDLKTKELEKIRVIDDINERYKKKTSILRNNDIYVKIDGKKEYYRTDKELLLSIKKVMNENCIVDIINPSDLLVKFFKCIEEFKTKLSISYNNVYVEKKLNELRLKEIHDFLIALSILQCTDELLIRHSEAVLYVGLDIIEVYSEFENK